MAPVAVSIAASHPLFLFYRHGIIMSADCGATVDSVVTIVGYGTEDVDIGGEYERIDYWLVKNSWGTSWGDHGYGKIAISEGVGFCGIN